MSLPEIVSREQWLVARKELLAAEKEITRARDAVNAQRRRLPMVEVARPTSSKGPTAEASLLDLFEGRRQLIVDHYMFEPEWEDGCPSCAGRVDQYGNLAHLHARDTTMAVVSRAPLEKIERWKHKNGWTFRWYSAYGSDSTTTSASRWTSASHPSSTTTARRSSSGPGSPIPGGAPRDQRVPARRRARVPHLLDLRARHRAGRRHALLPRHDRAGAPGGLGGAARALGRHGAPRRPGPLAAQTSSIVSASSPTSRNAV